MKKTLIILSMLCAGMANAATVLFDLDSTVLNGTNSVSMTSSDITITVTGSTANALRATNADNVSAWGDSTFDSGKVTTFNNFIGSDCDLGDAWKTFISGDAKTTDLTLTISGLTAGQSYDLGLIVGVPKEGAGSWTEVNSNNVHANSSIIEGLSTGALGQEAVQVNNPTGFLIDNMVADESGNITFVIEGNEFHSAGLAAVAISVVPEPATASLSLLGLAALMMRRRRA